MRECRRPGSVHERELEALRLLNKCLDEPDDEAITKEPDSHLEALQRKVANLEDSIHILRLELWSLKFEQMQTYVDGELTYVDGGARLAPAPMRKFQERLWNSIRENWQKCETPKDLQMQVTDSMNVLEKKSPCNHASRKTEASPGEGCNTRISDRDRELTVEYNEELKIFVLRPWIGSLSQEGFAYYLNFDVLWLLRQKA